MSKLFALENDNIEALPDVDAISPEEGATAEAQVEVDAEVAETEALATAVDEGTDAAGDMEEVETLVADAAENGEGLDTVAAEAVRLSVQAICKRIGADPKSVYSLYATENFASPSARKANTQIALEGVGEFLKDMWKRLKAAMVRMWEKVKAFWAKHVSTLGRVKKALEATKAKVKASSGKLNGKAFIEKAPSSLVSAFAGKGDLTVASVQFYLDSQKTIAAGATTTTDLLEAVGKNATDIAALRTAVGRTVSTIKADKTGIAIVGGEVLTMKFDGDDESKSLRLDVQREPLADVEEERGMPIPDKSAVIGLIDGALEVVKTVEQIRKDAEKSEQVGRDALVKMEKVITDAANQTPQQKEALRAGMSALYSFSAQGVKIRNIIASQGVRVSKAVITYATVCVKQYK